MRLMMSRCLAGRYLELHHWRLEPRAVAGGARVIVAVQKHFHVGLGFPRRPDHPFEPAEHALDETEELGLEVLRQGPVAVAQERGKLSFAEEVVAAGAQEEQMRAPELEILRHGRVEEIGHGLGRVAGLRHPVDRKLVRQLRDHVDGRVVRHERAVAGIAEPGIALRDDHRSLVAGRHGLDELRPAPRHLTGGDHLEEKRREQDGHGALTEPTLQL
jgi:hypothetical protein